MCRVSYAWSMTSFEWSRSVSKIDMPAPFWAVTSGSSTKTRLNDENGYEPNSAVR